MEEIEATKIFSLVSLGYGLVDACEDLISIIQVKDNLIKLGLLRHSKTASGCSAHTCGMLIHTYLTRITSRTSSMRKLDSHTMRTHVGLMCTAALARREVPVWR